MTSKNSERICVVCGAKIEEGHGYYDGSICSRECSTIAFWEGYINLKEDKESVRINGVHYWIGEEKQKSRWEWRGFDGAKFIIKFFDGRIVITTNLWCQGAIPTEFKDKLPDNAKFSEESEEQLYTGYGYNVDHIVK